MFYGFQNDYSVSVVYIGESTVDIKTEADSSDITVYPHDDAPSAGMFGVCDVIFFSSPCMTGAVFASHSFIC